MEIVSLILKFVVVYVLTAKFLGLCADVKDIAQNEKKGADK